MSLSGSQQEQIVKAFQEAFPRYNDLRYMLSTQLEENIEILASSDGNLRDCIFDIVVKMDARGRLKELLRGALNNNPGNPSLNKCGVAFGVYTSLESASLPPLHFEEFSHAPDDALFTHGDVELINWPSDYYREECLIADVDARSRGITENMLYAILSIQMLSVDKTVLRVAVRLLVDKRVKPGHLHINQQLGESIGLLSHGGRAWSLKRARNTMHLKKIVFEMRVERTKVDREISVLREHYQDVFMHLFTGRYVSAGA